MASLIASGAGPVILACRGQLVAQIPYLTASPTLCIIAAKDEVPHIGPDQDVVLRLGSYISVAAAYDGAGRMCTKLTRFLTMYPRVRLALDETGRDEIFLTDPLLGFAAWEETCANALIGFWPIDTAANFLTTCEIRLSEGTDPRRARMDQEWGDNAVTFEIEYLFSLNAQPWRPPLISTPSLPAATHGVAYSQALAVASPEIQGTGPYLFSSASAMPAGITLSAGGVLSGTPAVPGLYPLMILVIDAVGQRGATSFNLVVN